MTKIDLNTTKQSSQIAELRHCLEREGWKILTEVERQFRGEPRWELNDTHPNLIYSWVIQRNPAHPPLTLDFTAHWDYMTYKTHINDCSECGLRGTDIALYFHKDRGLKVEEVKVKWKEKLSAFLDKLSKLEKN